MDGDIEGEVEEQGSGPSKRRDGSARGSAGRGALQAEGEEGEEGAGPQGPHAEAVGEDAWGPADLPADQGPAG